MKILFPELQTPRLRLRELADSDIEALFAMHSNFANLEWYGTDHMNQREDAVQMLARFAQLRRAPVSGIRWAICTHDSDTMLGTCGFQKWNREWNSCMVRYDLKDDARGQGVMQEALRCALVWAFAGMRLNRVEAQIHPQNQASIRLVERLGFVREGLLRKAGYWDERYHDLWMYSLLKNEFYG